MAVPPGRRSLFRVVGLLLAIFALYNVLKGAHPLHGSQLPWAFRDLLRGAHSTKEALANLGMTEVQCRSTFPGLFAEIDESVSRGPFQLERANDDYMGLVQGRIKDGKLYIISHERKPNRDMLFERTAVLHALHRAILTTPSSEPLPDTTFTLTILDYPRNNSWSFSRPNDPVILSSGTANYWVMPHFSFWSWPLPFIGPIDQALSKIRTVEEETRWDEKKDKVVWRGTAWFNSVGNTDLRPKLLEKTKGKSWADVEDLNWVNNGGSAGNSIEIEEFCGYKYVIYTEGVTYSGRLPFHQACASVLITPPPNYLLHTAHLMRPVFSSTLLRPSLSAPQNKRWPKSYPPTQANVIFVDPKWEDLEATIEWLRTNDDIAKGIAKRQRGDFVEKGILSEAAESCYWRGLVRGWSSVVRLDDEKWKAEGGEGMRWETFSLTGNVQPD